MEFEIKEDGLLIKGILYPASDILKIYLRQQNSSVDIDWKNDDVSIQGTFDENQMDTVIQDLRDFAVRNNIDTIEE